MKQISTTAQIADTVIIHDDVIIEDDVIIHDYVVIYPNTIIHKGTEIFDHCVLGKMPTSPGNISRKVKISYKNLEIGSSCTLCPGVILYTGTIIDNNVLLGDNCSIREECTVGSNTIIGRLVCVNYNTQIGDSTKIMDGCIITGNMVIGNHVFFAAHVTTSNDNTMGKEEYDESHVIGATIKDGVTIGIGANILPQLVIEKNAIVAAGAVVTKSVPAGKVVMGVPARVVRDIE